MEIWKLITVMVGASGFWRIVDVLIKYRSDRTLKAAETNNLNASAEHNIIRNWIEWSQTLEKRVKEAEEQSHQMESIFEKQRKRIYSLEQKVEKLEAENRELLLELHELKQAK